MTRWGHILLLLSLCLVNIAAGNILKEAETLQEVKIDDDYVIYDEFKPPYPFEGHIPGADKLNQFEAVELPNTFETYDLDNNGYVTLTELAEVTETKVEDARRPFDVADINGDGVLDEGEFKKAPWAFKPAES